MNTLLNFLNNEEGASMAEYSLLLGLITVGIVGVINIFGSRIQLVFLRASSVIR